MQRHLATCPTEPLSSEEFPNFLSTNHKPVRVRGYVTSLDNLWAQLTLTDYIPMESYKKYMFNQWVKFTVYKSNRTNADLCTKPTSQLSIIWDK